MTGQHHQHQNHIMHHRWAVQSEWVLDWLFLSYFNLLNVNVQCGTTCLLASRSSLMSNTTYRYWLIPNVHLLNSSSAYCVVFVGYWDDWCWSSTVLSTIMYSTCYVPIELSTVMNKMNTVIGLDLKKWADPYRLARAQTCLTKLNVF